MSPQESSPLLSTRAPFYFTSTLEPVEASSPPHSSFWVRAPSPRFPFTCLGCSESCLSHYSVAETEPLDDSISFESDTHTEDVRNPFLSHSLRKASPQPFPYLRTALLATTIILYILLSSLGKGLAHSISDLVDWHQDVLHIMLLHIDAPILAVVVIAMICQIAAFYSLALRFDGDCHFGPKERDLEAGVLDEKTPWTSEDEKGDWYDEDDEKWPEWNEPKGLSAWIAVPLLVVGTCFLLWVYHGLPSSEAAWARVWVATGGVWRYSGGEIHGLF
ncbi:MAG: hypothetical protein M1814_005572 [Vezdaea aestivalis]|nr:MAG: hypothetical protein M1814_005572 [Vezdaea aestivalis]